MGKMNEKQAPVDGGEVAAGSGNSDNDVRKDTLGTNNISGVGMTSSTPPCSGAKIVFPGGDTIAGDNSEEEGERKGCCQLLRTKFTQPEVEEMYQKYLAQSKRGGLVYVLMFSVIFDLIAVIITSSKFHTSRLGFLVTMCVFAALGIVFCLVCLLCRLSDTVYKVLPYLIWFYMFIQVVLQQVLYFSSATPTDCIGWKLFLVFAIYAVLPLRLRWCVVLSIITCILHLAVSAALVATGRYSVIFSLTRTTAANAVLLWCANVLGVLSFLFNDNTQRRAFLETKHSLTINLQLEQGQKEQEGLLLSVLPRHVATEMIKDLGLEITGQFRKIYMNRHENVSILFADIVGFTALSSSVTASELVRILNDLFATFDKLASKYHQLRIKILGDCYYCICGCPDPRPDHAVLSIHMGLAMVEAISYVRENTKSGVNMRVGIHTGPVLGGVLGQHRWQYDVLGKEVTLANHMESGGLPGRVHISEVTAKFLDSEFELEPGGGETRDDTIKMAGMKTYLVKKVSKPYPEGTLDESPIVSKPVNEDSEGNLRDKSRSGEVDPHERLLQALADKDRMKNVKLHPFTLSFKESNIEEEYNTQTQRRTSVALATTAAVLLLCSISQFLVLPIEIYSVSSFLVGEVLLVMFALMAVAPVFPRVFPSVLVRCAKWTEKTPWFRNTWTTLMVLILLAASVLDMLGCRKTTNYPSSKQTLDPSSEMCEHPVYFPMFGLLLLINIALLVQLTYLLKAVLALLVSAVYLILILIAFPWLYDSYDQFLYRFDSSGWAGQIPTKWSIISVLIAVAMSVVTLGRYMELNSRRSFYFRHEAEAAQSQIGVMREKNESLVYNILPSHVAHDFIGVQRNHDELYSQSYDEVGVMFASCPNFNDFYTEDAVNNNGLECIRFLNEILSDYDDLLTDERFLNVTKIKTVGSTYMAASGLHLENISKEASVTARWRHLADLVEFGLALKETLDRLNAQSFNTFKLRIGINHGPILAGVIGATKPHYDIWGNTVNVASRMESTGQLGKIQVVEETMKLLSEFGFIFEKRGLVKVKGKGDLMTYFLTGRDSEHVLPNQCITDC